jgi:hypothetical protein
MIFLVFIPQPTFPSGSPSGAYYYSILDHGGLVVAVPFNVETDTI